MNIYTTKAPVDEKKPGLVFQTKMNADKRVQTFKQDRALNLLANHVPYRD